MTPETALALTPETALRQELAYYEKRERDALERIQGLRSIVNLRIDFSKPTHDGSYIRPREQPDVVRATMSDQREASAIENGERSSTFDDRKEYEGIGRFAQ